MTNVQTVNQKQRAVYESLAKPLLQQLTELHGLTIRDVAAVFSISKGHAEGILKHRVFPSLELSVRIARYFEVSVDDLFAWRVDDSGERRPLLIELPGIDVPIRLNKWFERDALKLVEQLAEAMKCEGGVEEMAAELKRR
jgi:transcriptional regulator with XRE-family HTH domain